MRDNWNFLHHPRLTSGETDEIYRNATDLNLNIMKNDKLKISSVGIFQFTFGQFVYWSERAN